MEEEGLTPLCSSAEDHVVPERARSPFRVAFLKRTRHACVVCCEKSYYFFLCMDELEDILDATAGLKLSALPEIFHPSHLIPTWIQERPIPVVVLT